MMRYRQHVNVSKLDEHDKKLIDCKFTADLPSTLFTPPDTTRITKKPTLTPPAPTSTTTRVRTRGTRPAPTTIRATDIVKVTNRTRRPTSRTTASVVTPSVSPSIIIAGHPQDNEIAGSSHVQHGEGPNVNIPLSVDGERREAFGAKLNLGAIIALGAFGAFIFLAAIVTTIVILVRR